MRYFKIYDDLAPEGDVYRFDGETLRLFDDEGAGTGWGMPHPINDLETVELYLDWLCGPFGGWEELDEFTG